MRSLLAAALIALSLVVPGTALAAIKAGQPFPSNLFTTSDRTQVTALRVDLPKPDCAMRPSDCADIDVVNTLDGFNIQPRISIPFSGPIDVATVSSQSVFLIGPRGRRVGINQVVWEPAANTLHVESDEQLEAHSKYLLVVTRGVRGSDGQSLDGSAFWRELLARGPAADKAYRTQLLLALGAEADPEGPGAHADLCARYRRRADGLPPLVDHRDQVDQADGNLHVQVIDPDGAGPIFETPMVGPPPEDLAFLP